MPSKPTVERIRELFHYEVVTGRFYRKVATKNTKIGPAKVNDNGRGYLYIFVDGKRYAVHRLAYIWITGEWPEHEVDHINHTRDCNAWHNLRHATAVENRQNSSLRSDNSSGIKGVSFVKPNNNWCARIYKDGVKHWIGVFPTKEEAAAALRVARETLHGEFARH
jgi:hypothetical protein